MTDTAPSPAPVIKLDPAKILGGVPDGNTKVAAGSKQVGLKASHPAE